MDLALALATVHQHACLKYPVTIHRNEQAIAPHEQSRQSFAYTH